MGWGRRECAEITAFLFSQRFAIQIGRRGCNGYHCHLLPFSFTRGYLVLIGFFHRPKVSSPGALRVLGRSWSASLGSPGFWGVQILTTELQRNVDVLST